MLPAAKSGFPKFLYLDQNKWIDLSRAHYGHSEGAQFEDALDAIRNAIGRGTLVVPISGINAIETMNDGYEDRRQRLAEFMVELAGNHFLLPYLVVRPIQITQAVVRKLNRRPAVSIREKIVEKGLSYAFGVETSIVGLPKKIEEELKSTINSASSSVQCLVHAGDRVRVDGTRQEDKTAAELETITRQQMSADMTSNTRHHLELAELFSRGGPGEELRNTLKLIGISREKFFSLFDEADEWLEFFHDIATVDVQVTLTLERDKNLSRPVHRNDERDIAFLSMALPYANIVVCEKFWAQITRTSGLDNRYKTVIETDLTKLPNILDAQECL